MNTIPVLEDEDDDDCGHLEVFESFEYDDQGHGGEVEENLEDEDFSEDD